MSYGVLLAKLEERLLDRFQEGYKTVIFIDEAQLIDDDDVFEELRLLLNHQLNDRFLLTLFLTGQPELRESVMRMPQFEQRLSIKYHLHAFGLQETYKYINFRLRTAGAGKPLFDQEAVKAIYSGSYGVPRRINSICDLALLTGARRGTDRIDSAIIQSVL